MGEIKLHVCIEDLLMKAGFHIVENLAADIPLGTILSHKTILDILTHSKVAVPCKSKTVSIPSPQTTNADVNIVVAAGCGAAPVVVTATKALVGLCVGIKTWLNQKKSE